MRENIDLLLGILFVGVWFFYLKLFSIHSGWSLLAKEFGFKGKFSGKIFRCLNINGYNTTHVGLNEDGLYLAVVFPFRPFHKPLFIPWEKIKFASGKRLFFSGYYITIDSYEKYKFFILNNSYKKFEDYIPVNSKLTSE